MKREILIWALASTPVWSMAQPTVEPAVPARDVLTLSAQATVEVPYDAMAITLAASRDAPDAASVQAQLRQAIDAALADARRAAKPGEIDVRTGGFSLSPRYGNQGRITGWAGSAELVLEGRDMSGIAQLAGRLNTLAVSRVAYSLSRATRERAEADAVAQAIARFRARALDYAKQFGFAGYTVREVQVGNAEPEFVQPMMRARMSAAPTSDAIPVEAGKASVNVTVNGAVQMTR
ncbi:MAG: SIMPL domain-containing protein [Ideonella sp.]|nr:SIMPL domain-containing protein [Ideonella sp.]MCC7457524.1 SIMPL domain-containing protein [Nitrospira sp.]